MGKKVRCILMLLAITLMVQSQTPFRSYAGMFMITSEFDGLSGDGKYLGADYRGNYHLDMEPLGITEVGDKALNALANVVFYAIYYAGYVSVIIFYYAMDFDLAKLILPLMSGMQARLRDGFFLPLLQWGMIGVMIIAFIKYVRRDLVGILEQGAKVIILVVLSVLVVRDSATMLSNATGITKELSVAILTGVSDRDIESSVDDYSAEAAGVLWTSLVHEPWKSLEFGSYEYSSDDVEFFLTSSGDARDAHIKAMQETSPGIFSKNQSAERIGQGLMILLTMLVKCGIYIAVSLMFLVFQVIAVLFVIMAPLVLILAMLPGYDFQVLSIWFRKLLETQISVLLLTFVVGLMVMLDLTLQNLATEIGWFIALLIQIGACVALFVYRWKIFSAFNTAQHAILNPRMMMRDMRMMKVNPYDAVETAHENIEQLIENRSRDRHTQIGREADRYRASTKAAPEKMIAEKSDKTRTLIRPQTISEHTETARIATGAGSDYQAESVTGIKSETFYASREVTDNWRELWDEARPAERPQTTDGMENHTRRSQGAMRGGIRNREMAQESFSDQQSIKERSMRKNPANGEIMRQNGYFDERAEEMKDVEAEAVQREERQPKVERPVTVNISDYRESSRRTRKPAEQAEAPQPAITPTHSRTLTNAKVDRETPPDAFSHPANGSERAERQVSRPDTVRQARPVSTAEPSKTPVMPSGEEKGEIDAARIAKAHIGRSGAREAVSELGASYKVREAAEASSRAQETIHRPSTTDPSKNEAEGTLNAPEREESSAANA